MFQSTEIPVIIFGLILLFSPLLFELYTFQLYLLTEPSYFAFSGARLWFFLFAMISAGFIIGRTHKFYYNTTALGLGVASFLLILVVYQFCDYRQCYYSGGDGLGWIRVWVLLFATLLASIVASRTFRHDRIGTNPYLLTLFISAVVIFLNYYVIALLYGIFNAYPVTLFLLVYASTVPFFIGGLVTVFFTGKIVHAVISSVMASIVLLSLFFWLQTNNLLPVVIIPAGIVSSVLGYKFSKRILTKFWWKNNKVLIFVCILAPFFITAIHPFVDAPMNLSIYDSGQTLYSFPTYYTGAYYGDNYFSTNRVETGIILENISQYNLKNGNFFSAGMGVQSPNCCKDGLDYGYRADILFSENGRYLLARAWETCDQNIACSGTPWQSKIHETIVPLNIEKDKVELAMEIGKDRIARWYYKTPDAEWTLYSTFKIPEIENAHFNIGEFKQIGAFAFLSNPPSGSAHFYQFGYAASNETLVGGKPLLRFTCPAYYTSDSVKHCISNIETIEDANSHWKVLWKWGIS